MDLHSENPVFHTYNNSKIKYDGYIGGLLEYVLYILNDKRVLERLWPVTEKVFRNDITSRFLERVINFKVNESRLPFL